MNKTIYMQYPYDENNPLYDGLEHEIIPYALTPANINGHTFFVMNYYDLSANSELVTLLGVVNGRFYKVPLQRDEYARLHDFIDPYEMPFNPSEIAIGESIGLAIPFSLPQTKYPPKNGYYSYSCFHLLY